MPIIAETHCHTVACDHAYSTITENARAAAKKGVKYLCITEHGPSMLGAPHECFFGNIVETIPRKLEGVTMLYGVEANIIDFNGTLDVESFILNQLDWVIASYHTVCIKPATKEDHTRGWLAIAQNPLVDVIGHCGDERYDFDFDIVIPAFHTHGKIVEINAHSFDCRPGSRERCREIALACKKHGVQIVCSSDAHFHEEIATTQAAEIMLKEIEFPEELILNYDEQKFLDVMRDKIGSAL